MFFFISKILSYLLSPLFWVMLLLFLGIITEQEEAIRRLVVALALLYLLSNHFLVSEVMRIWEVPVRDTPATYSAGIVLGGNILNYDRENKREIFRDNPDRLFQAIKLYKQGKINKIIISGGPGHIMYPDEYEAAYAGRYLSSIGIPEEDILVDSLSVNTRENAVNTAEIINHYELSGHSCLSHHHIICAGRLAVFIRQESISKLTR